MTESDAFGLEWTLRTYLRIFLVLAGGLFLIWWTETGDLIELILGLLSIIVGAAGLWIERTGELEE